MGFRKILCAVDFSEPSRRAMRTAAELAVQAHAPLTLLHVFQIPTYALPDGVLFQLPESGLTGVHKGVKRALEEWQGEARGLGVSSVEGETAEGIPWKEIVARAEKGGFDLVVIGTHGHTGLAHLVLGSVAERVVRHAQCPVLTVRAPAAA